MNCHMLRRRAASAAPSAAMLSSSRTNKSSLADLAKVYTAASRRVRDHKADIATFYVNCNVDVVHCMCNHCQVCKGTVHG